MHRKDVVFSKMFVLRSMGNELVPSPLKCIFNIPKDVKYDKCKVFSVGVIMSEWSHNVDLLQFRWRLFHTITRNTIVFCLKQMHLLKFFL